MTPSRLKPALFGDLTRSLMEQRIRELGGAPPAEASVETQPAPLSRAAVALVVCPNERGESCFVLTRRALGLRNHGGQWALPGGRMEHGESPEQTARRELLEEVGLELPHAAVLGQLDDFTTRSGFRITPVVLWCANKPILVVDKNEVAGTYLVTLRQFDRPEVPILRPIPESDRLVLSLPMNDTEFFAPTAAIVYQLFEIAFNNRIVRVGNYEQPVFAWK